MTPPEDDRPAAAPRRPPGAPTQWATVTRLGVAPGDQAGAGAATPPVVEGSLALQAPATEQTSARQTSPEPAIPGQATADGAVPGLPETPELRLVRGSTAGGEDVQLWAARFAQAVVEVLGGDRPLPQLVRWTSQRVYAELERRLNLLARTSDAGRRRRTVRPQVRSVHVFHPTPESAEVSVHVRHGERSRAIAARLELSRGRWQCTVLQLG